ncbi:unnamed protein product [Candida verbasci]|uniref:Cargo-transport protein YPP1 n=1 Tax=Candida verbasci TaxID=1227364 RepID=A0A9W4TYR7_9ASCO|nr:unnamed protein product [Candida verbasci]
MYIENSINDKYIKTLNLGCFPKNVLQFQDSQDYFQQLIFIDYQLQLLISNEFKNDQLLSLAYFENNTTLYQAKKEKLLQLINYHNSINLNYKSSIKSFKENFYNLTLQCHLLYLNNHNVQDLIKILSSFNIIPNDNEIENNISEFEFIQFLTIKYNVLLSNCYSSFNSNYQLQIYFDYLEKFQKPFSKSQIISNFWFEILFKNLSAHLTKKNTIQLSFDNHLRNLPFFKNKFATINYSNFLLRPENLNFVNKSFKNDYSNYLLIDVEENMHSKSFQFPNASESSSNNQINDFINNLYESLSYVPFNLSILKPQLSKKFLIDCTKKTFQSKIILSNLIYTLIDLGEYDEAFQCFITYIDYLVKGEKLKNGYIEDILSIIDTFSTCIIYFNPLKSFKNNNSKFKNIDLNFINDTFTKNFIPNLQRYLDELSKLIDLTYDDENYAGDKNPLSFLYKKYNLNILQTDHSQFIELISKAWFSIGNYYYYLSIYESINLKSMEFNVSQILLNYKNSLIINSTGNVLYLFNYALVLANVGNLKFSLKLCKFILKKYPESFKTWNLLVLILTSLNNDNNDTSIPLKFNDNILDGQLSQQQSPPPQQQQQKMRDPEKFINKALNIAGLYIMKYIQKDIKLTLESKYEILQLKLTQMAVLESVHGHQYMMDYLSEVFVLYHELFDVQLNSNSTNINHSSARQFGSNDKWSHRPSFIDPKIQTNQQQSKKDPASSQPIGDIDSVKSIKKSVGTGNTVDKLRRLSKISRKDSFKKNEILTPPPSAAQPVQQPKQTLSRKTSRQDNPIATTANNKTVERKILQEIWLWTSRVFLKNGLMEECEQCIIEAETIYEPNIKTFTSLGYLTSKSRKFLSLQEFERSLEIFNKSNKFNNQFDYGLNLLGLCKLFLVDDNLSNSLFISEKDMNCAIIRLKNLLELYSLTWPFGYNNSEVWFYLSKIYEYIDDKILLTSSLWKCIELEDKRPVRQFEICDSSIV